MRHIHLIDKSYQYWFRCRATQCDACSLKFRCHTTRGGIEIENSGLAIKLFQYETEKTGHNRYKTYARKIRKEFFRLVLDERDTG